MNTEAQPILLKKVDCIRLAVMLAGFFAFYFSSLRSDLYRRQGIFYKNPN